jgi:tetratricopeptide (TPR) repeat protein
MKNRNPFLSLLFVSIVLLLIPIQELQAQRHGDVNFNADCEEAVQDDVDEAIAMLHNMIYVAAREDFEEITTSDPNCAIAYWGIATTLFQPLWGTRPSDEDLNRGWSNIEKAREMVDSDREKHLIEATAGFFKEPETAGFWTRIERWAEGMEEAYEAYPEDDEIASFYSLSRLTLAQRVDDRAPFHDEAEKILGDIYERTPTHPGAIHYSIHATDVDGRAENALDRVEAYSQIAPDNPHALHMPSHIYVRLGDWPRVIDWNKKSAEAALKHSVNGAVSHHYIHANDYLVYAYLQQGDEEKIGPILEEVQNKGQYQASFISAFHFAAMPARIAVELRDWEKASKLEPRTPEYLPWDASLWAEGITWLARGLGAVHTGNVDSAIEAEQRLNELRESAISVDARDMANYIEIDRRILEGWIAHARGDDDKAVELLQSAAELEKGTEKHPVTPGALLPPKEALGDLLMELDRPGDALAAYEESDSIWPERYNTLLGAARAARQAGVIITARNYYERLLANTNGDADRTGIHEARGFIAENE